MVVSFEPFLRHLPAWLMVLFRLAGIFMFAPMFGSVLIPGRVKILLAVGLSLCIYPMLLMPGTQAAANMAPLIEQGLSFWSLISVVVAELGIGLLIGFGASLPLTGMQLGGRMIAQQMGLGLAEVFSPGEQQAGIISRLMFLFALLAFLVVDGHLVLLGTLIDCFHTVPPGGFRVDQRVMDLILGLLSSMLHLAIRVAGPLLCLVFLQSVAMGFIGRTVPQMNILSIGFVVRIFVGVTILIAAMQTKAGVMVDAIWHGLGSVASFFGSGS